MAIEQDAKQFNPEVARVDNGKFIEEFGEPCFELGARYREEYDKTVDLSRKFLAGTQTASQINDNLSLYTRKIPGANPEIQRIDNQLPIQARQIASTCGENMPDLEAIPASYNDQQAIANAAVGTTFLQWRDRVDKERLLRNREVMWMLVAGEVLRKTYYDPDAGNDGDLVTEVVDFFRYVKDPYSIERDYPRWLIEYDVRHVDEVAQMFGQRVEPENVADRTRYVDEFAVNSSTGRMSRREAQKESALLKRLYTPPSKKYPNGYCWVWANGVLLRVHDLQAGKWPYARSEWFPIPGRLYALSLIEQLLADQRYLNTVLSMMHDVMVRQLRGDIITSGRDQEATRKIIDPRTGQTQIMLPRGVEKWGVMQYNTDWRLGEMALEMSKNNMREKGGNNRPTLGQEVSGQHTLGELELAHESDMGNLAWHVNNYTESGVVPTAELKLALAEEYIKNFHEATVPGNKGSVMFTGDDLSDIGGVIARPVPHLTPAMKRQAHRDATTQGLTGPYPSLQAQLAARLLLRSQGLTEIEEEVAQTYGPMEELEQKCKQLAAQDADIDFEKRKLAMIQIKAEQATIMTAMIPQTVPQNAGQPQAGVAA